MISLSFSVVWWAICSQILGFSSCSRSAPLDSVLRVGIYAPPRTLNPRQATDATGQQLGELLFESPFYFDENLDVKSRVVTSSRYTDQGFEMTFRPGKDHSGQRMSAADWAKCFENYRSGKPSFRSLGAFPGWSGTRLSANRITLLMRKPNPFIRRNLSLIRFFRSRGTSEPCAPSPKLPLVTSGLYSVRGKLNEWSPQDGIELQSESGHSDLRFQFFVEQTLAAFHLLRGSLDVAYNQFEPSQEEYFSDKDGFRLISQPGIRVTYLAMNFRRKLIQNLAVRRAISLAIDRDLYVRKKLNRRGHVAHSFLSPALGGLKSGSPAMNRAQANTLLDEAGFPRGPDGFRFRLTYLTTGQPVGYERALIFAGDLKKVGIRLDIKTVERGLFFSSLKSGSYDLYSSRWVGVKDPSIFHMTLHSSNPRNRVAYANPEIDQWLEELMSGRTVDAALVSRIEHKMLEDLPYLPLWFWNNTLVARDRIRLPQPFQISPAGALTSLIQISRPVVEAN